MKARFLNTRFYSKYFICILFLAFCTNIAGQIQPNDHGHLNYTQVLLEVPEVSGAIQYKFIIIEKGGDFSSPLIEQMDSSQVTIVDGLDFGKSYKWKALALNKQSELLQDTGIFHFQIGKSPLVDPEKHRFRLISDSPGEYKDGVIFLDYSRVAINRKGKPVWFLPQTDGLGSRQDHLRDLKLSHAGTITFMAMKLCREITLDGKTIWETPGNGKVSGDTVEFYHHEFSRLRSGNYMVLGKSYREKKLVSGSRVVNKIPLSVIIEYNFEGDTIWTWDSDNYIKENDILIAGKKVFMGNTFGHMNSFYARENTGEIYASFRDLNAVIVIDKKTRKVIRTYGDKIPSDTTELAIGFFKKQHAPIPLGNNKILLFNNNEIGENNVSTVQIFTEPLYQGGPSVIEWEFKCDFDDRMPGFASRMGNAQPIDTTHYLVNMGRVARLFEVTKEKKITWDCLPESWNADSLRWEPEPNYRLAFSKSLYPSYFSFSLRENENSNGYYLSIVNEGSEEDEYYFRIIPGNKDKKACKYETGTVKGGNSYVNEMKILNEKKFRKNFTVEVHSARNRGLMQRKTYTYPSK